MHSLHQIKLVIPGDVKAWDTLRQEFVSPKGHESESMTWDALLVSWPKAQAEAEEWSVNWSPTDLLVESSLILPKDIPDSLSAALNDHASVA